MGSDYIRQWFLNVVEFALQGAFLVVTMGGGAVRRVLLLASGG